MLKINHYLKSTPFIFQSLLSSAIPGATAYFCHDGVQTTRKLDASDTKDKIKDAFAIVSSTVDALAIAQSQISLLSKLLNSGVWNKLSTLQKTMLITSELLALGAGAYSMAVFNDERHIMVSGITASASVLTSNLLTLFAKSVKNNNEERLEAEEKSKNDESSQSLFLNTP